MLCSHSLYMEDVNDVIMALRGEKEMLIFTRKFRSLPLHSTREKKGIHAHPTAVGHRNPRVSRECAHITAWVEKSHGG